MAIGTTAAALIGGGLGAAGSYFGGKKAAGAVGDASAASIAEQRRQFDIATGLARPAIDSGNTARNQLMQLLGLGGPSGGAQGVAQGSPFSGPSFNRQFGNQMLGGRMPNRDQMLDRDSLIGGYNSLLRDPRGGEWGGMSSGGVLPSNTNISRSQNPIDIIKNTPGYQFQLEQGTRALNANRSAGGNTGGALMKDFARFNQGVASNFYSDYANRLAGLAGSAQTASTQLGNQGILSGQIVGNAIQDAGNARASGIVGATNAGTGFLTEIFELLGKK